MMPRGYISLKAAIAGGMVFPLFMVLGSFGSNQVVAIGSITAVLDGMVSLGSNVGRPNGI
jgi:hypothetical protein